MADALVIVLALVAGLAVGAWLGYLLAKREEAKAKDQLADTFKALATDALRGNSETFIGQATQAFKTVKTEAEGDLAQRQQAIEGLIKPLNEALQRYETQIASMERARQSAYGGLDQHLKTLAQAHERLQQETGNLVKALRSPQVRGQWGEITLKRVAELAGMVEHCDFREQETVQGETGRLRPDMIIQLPAGRQIVVDAKTVLAAYLEAVEAQDDEVRRERLRQHATQVRARMDQLSAKAYWSQFAQAPEFVVLFLPGEQFLGAALEYDRTLIEEGFAKKVVIATPTTLIAPVRCRRLVIRILELVVLHLRAQMIEAPGPASLARRDHHEKPFPDRRPSHSCHDRGRADRSLHGRLRR